MVINMPLDLTERSRPRPSSVDYVSLTGMLHRQILDLASVIMDNCPQSEERQAALRHLDAVAFYAVASVARD